MTVEIMATFAYDIEIKRFAVMSYHYRGYPHISNIYTGKINKIIESKLSEIRVIDFQIMQEYEGDKFLDVLVMYV